MKQENSPSDCQLPSLSETLRCKKGMNERGDKRRRAELFTSFPSEESVRGEDEEEGGGSEEILRIGRDEKVWRRIGSDSTNPFESVARSTNILFCFSIWSC